MTDDLSSWFAKALEVIARATPGPRWESLGGVLFSGDTCIGSISLDGKGHVYNLSDGDLIVLAVNSLPSLLDAAEAAEKVHDAMEKYQQTSGYHSYRALLDAHTALDAALARLAQEGAK